ncbi:hypothetical protein [Mycolicibacterium celeriflavum]|uniref:Uncharacterized protein n=1 Tax=Mycolicibacterium celeriflavum TaxID=1249101 RepID=A0A1X0BTV9_MYCCF|nr:hypothetical protein [Mycolicibacterium celeriflavum]MCV7239887.1 hypothetical protein [Mycolicibacterium celeriflavum]ORA47218.1 hypothetical protein BST21_13250 [Mycolicibacterium celeriflavum]BBY44269.1 hypothetical protein MCEL_25640 [Mycolicibacterium celeriflavum]
MTNNTLFIVAYTLLSAGLQVFGICRTAHFRTWEIGPGRLLYEFDMPTGWRKIRGPVYISLGIGIQVIGTLATLVTI